MRHADLHGGHAPHVLFQASTIGALLDGAFEGDVSFAELTEQGDHRLGTADVEGSMVGFRFPAYVEGIEVSGWHLQFISEDRSRGGHVLDSRSSSVRVRLDSSCELHVELPPGVRLTDPAQRRQHPRGDRSRRAPGVKVLTHPEFG